MNECKICKVEIVKTITPMSEIYKCPICGGYSRIERIDRATVINRKYKGLWHSELYLTNYCATKSSIQFCGIGNTEAESRDCLLRAVSDAENCLNNFKSEWQSVIECP